jgi:hypothetical protein
MRASSCRNVSFGAVPVQIGSVLYAAGTGSKKPWRSVCDIPPYPGWTATFTISEDRMAEIHVEPKRGGWGRVLTIILGLVIIVAIAYYFLYYRNG